ncbi:MAG: radical SAM protein, partial [Niameybacter sp.]
MMELIQAKTLIVKNKMPEFWFGHDYNMNIYKGCSHGCIYCDSRSECYRVDDFDRVRAKDNALTLIEQELRKKRDMAVIGTGSMSDPYNPKERKYLLTRQALEIIKNTGHGVAIATKSSLITRDIDLLVEINQKAPVCTKLTVTICEDSLSQCIEPHIDISSKRFSAIKEMSEQGIFTGVLLWPVLPFVTDTEENILGIVEKAHQSGANFV